MEIKGRTAPRARTVKDGPGARMMAARIAAGLTQDQVAARLGVTRATLSNWERGTTAPKAAAVVQMASLYNVDIQTII